MKTLLDAITDYKLAELQAIAERCGVPLPQSTDRATRLELVKNLLSPVHMEIVRQDLSADELAALQMLVAAGGSIEARKFSRAYGDVRKMGSNRLQREKPWEAPQNPAECLWYRGFIFKDFHHTSHGPEEVVFIPSDIMQALPIARPPKNTIQWEIATVPNYQTLQNATAKEDLFNFLVYLQNNFIHLAEDGSIPAQHIQAIQKIFCHTYGSTDASALYYFDFILHLARRMNFLRKQGRRLKLHSEAVRRWLQSAPETQLAAMQNIWRADPTWNDLWHTPGLNPQPTGWENSPMLGRSKILHHLSGITREEWVTIDGFIRAIKTIEPDFQRPDGDYGTWYIHDDNNQPLMGFENWDAVEGRFIRHMLSNTLVALGVIVSGGPSEAVAPTVIKLTPAGERFFRRKKQPETPAPPRKSLRINANDFTVKITRGIDLFHRFQLARIAEFVKNGDTGSVYRFTHAGYVKALEQNISLEQILGFLKRATNQHIPLQLVDALHQWDKRTGAVKLEHLTVLRVNDAATLQEIYRHPDISPLLGPPLGPTAALVPENNVDAIENQLRIHGYL